jgi:ABC-type branched-subunit amino acid transport system substrate-binding protein
MCDRANTFGFTGCLLPDDAYKSLFTVASFLELLKDSPDKSIAMVGVDNASGIQGVQNTKNALQKAGLNVVKTTNQFTQGQPPADPSPFVRDIMTSNNGKPPTMVYHVTDFTNVASLTQALSAAGYKGIQVSAVGYDPRLAGFKGLDNTYVSLQWLPSEATDNPVVKQMTSDIQQYGQGAPLALTTTAGWLSADMLVAGLKATGKDLTVDNFLKTMNGGSFHYGDGIYSGQTTWPDNHFYGTPCGTITHLSGGKYTLTVPLVCNSTLK